MELLIYEHDEQVGSVDLDAETYEYKGEKASIDRVLTDMQKEGFMSRVPVREYTDEKGRRNRVTRRKKRTGADLGRFLVGAIEEKGHDGEVQTEAIGFDREYTVIKVGEHPDFEESAGAGDQSESIDSSAETSKEPASSNPN